MTAGLIDRGRRHDAHGPGSRVVAAGRAWSPTLPSGSPSRLGLAEDGVGASRRSCRRAWGASCSCPTASPRPSRSTPSRPDRPYGQVILATFAIGAAPGSSRWPAPDRRAQRPAPDDPRIVGDRPCLRLRERGAGSGSWASPSGLDEAPSPPPSSRPPRPRRRRPSTPTRTPMGTPGDVSIYAGIRPAERSVRNARTCAAFLVVPTWACRCGWPRLEHDRPAGPATTIRSSCSIDVRRYDHRRRSPAGTPAGAAAGGLIGRRPQAAGLDEHARSPQEYLEPAMTTPKPPSRSCPSPSRG